MLDILHPKNLRYLERLPSHDDLILREMEMKAQREGFPIVGPLVGQLLMVLTKAIKATRVFEMGSGFGYSGLYFAKALPAGGRVVLTDTSATRLKEAQGYFRQAKQADKVECRVGDAIELITHTSGPFDIIFLDADKARYPLAFTTAVPKLRPGGLFIADNILWFGQVIERHPDTDTRGILEFTRLISTTSGLVSTILPLRDGVSVSLKLAGDDSY